MSHKSEIKNKRLFEVLRILSNEFRFKILELTQDSEQTISKLSSKIGLSYNKCSDYVRLLENKKLVEKIRKGKNVYVKSKISLSNNWLKI